MPLVGRKPVGHKVNVGITAVLLIGVVWLSYISVSKDLVSKEHQTALADGRIAAMRARELAQAPAGIPVTGR